MPYKCIFGYRKGNDGELELVPEEAAVIKKIFSRYLGGLSAKSINEELDVDGVLTLRGKSTWSIGIVQEILKNERYTGNVVLQKTYVTDPLTKKSKKNYGQLPQYYEAV